MSFWEKDNRRIHFVHIPKAAGTSVRQLLKSNGWVERKDLRINNSKHNILNQYSSNLKKFNPEFSFSIVRNPITRALSRIYQVERQVRDHLNNKEFKVDPDQLILNMFTSVFLKEGYDVDDNHWLPQYLFLSENTIIFKNEKISNLLDFLILKKIVNKDSELKKLNAASLNYKSFNENSIKMLKEFYFKDFHFLNYKPDIKL